MNINEMSTEEKSAVLSKLMGWRWLNRLDDNQHVIDASGVFLNAGRYRDLYLPDNFRLAWRILNWACVYLNHEVLQHAVAESVFSTPDIAQAAWLDKILELAIKAGMVASEQRNAETS